MCILYTHGINNFFFHVLSGEYVSNFKWRIGKKRYVIKVHIIHMHFIYTPSKLEINSAI